MNFKEFYQIFTEAKKVWEGIDITTSLSDDERFNIISDWALHNEVGGANVVSFYYPESTGGWSLRKVMFNVDIKKAYDKRDIELKGTGNWISNSDSLDKRKNSYEYTKKDGELNKYFRGIEQSKTLFDKEGNIKERINTNAPNKNFLVSRIRLPFEVKDFQNKTGIVIDRRIDK